MSFSWYPISHFKSHSSLLCPIVHVVFPYRPKWLYNCNNSATRPDLVTVIITHECWYITEWYHIDINCFIIYCLSIYVLLSIHLFECVLNIQYTPMCMTITVSRYVGSRCMCFITIPCYICVHIIMCRRTQWFDRLDSKCHVAVCFERYTFWRICFILYNSQLSLNDARLLTKVLIIYIRR